MKIIFVILFYVVFATTSAPCFAAICGSIEDASAAEEIVTSFPLNVRWITKANSPLPSTLDYREYKRYRSRPEVVIPKAMFDHFAGASGRNFYLLNEDGVRVVIVTDAAGKIHFELPNLSDYEGPKPSEIVNAPLKGMRWAEQPFHLENGFRLLSFFVDRSSSSWPHYFQTGAKRYATATDERVDIFYYSQLSTHGSGDWYMDITDVQYNSVAKTGHRYRKLEMYYPNPSTGRNPNLIWTEADSPPSQAWTDDEKIHEEQVTFRFYFSPLGYHLTSAVVENYRSSMPPALSAILPRLDRGEHETLEPEEEGYRQLVNYVLNVEAFPRGYKVLRGNVAMPLRNPNWLVQLADGDQSLKMSDFLMTNHDPE